MKRNGIRQTFRNVTTEGLEGVGVYMRTITTQQNLCSAPAGDLPYQSNIYL